MSSDTAHIRQNLMSLQHRALSKLKSIYDLVIKSDKGGRTILSDKFKES